MSRPGRGAGSISEHASAGRLRRAASNAENPNTENPDAENPDAGDPAKSCRAPASRASPGAGGGGEGKLAGGAPR